MAQITVTGDIVQIKTSLTKEEFETFQHFVPDALKCKDEKGNEYFSINIGDAHYSAYGVTFCNTDADGKLFMATRNPVHDHSDPEDEKKKLSREFAQIIFNLQCIEDQVNEFRPHIAGMIQNANEAITIL